MKLKTILLIAILFSTYVFGQTVETPKPNEKQALELKKVYDQKYDEAGKEVKKEEKK